MSTNSPPVRLDEITPHHASQRLSEGSAVLVDVREPDEHARERIAGSTLIPLSKFDAARALALSRDGQGIILHCRGGRRSMDAARQAAALAPTGTVVSSMAGGLEAWKQAGLPVRTNAAAPRMSVMRQVQLTIGAGVLAGAALTWFVHPAFIAVPAFFGAGLIFAGATGTCGLAALLERMPWNRVPKCGAECKQGH